MDRVRINRATTWIAWTAAAGFALWALIRLAGIERGFPLVPLIAYTPYVAVCAVLAAGLAFVLEQPAPAATISLCALALVAVVVPRAIPDDPPDPRPQGPELRVLAVNLMLGDADLEALAGLVRDERIDVVSFAELTPETDAAIAASPIAEQLPNAVGEPEEGSAGTGLRSRYPLRRLEAPGSEGNDLPTIRAAVELPGGVVVEVYSIHPFAPSSPSRQSQNARYLDAIPPADPSGASRLLIGDFNATLDQERLRDVLDRGYTDAADARGAGLVWTWPQGFFPPPVTIDHVLVDERVEVLDFGTADLEGTDHRAIRASLRLPEPLPVRAPD